MRIVSEQERMRQELSDLEFSINQNKMVMEDPMCSKEEYERVAKENITMIMRALDLKEWLGIY